MMKFLLNLLGNFIGPISDEKLEKIKPWLKLFLVISIVIIIVFYIIGEKFMFKNRKGFWSISTNGSLASELDFSTSELVSRRSRRPKILLISLFSGGVGLNLKPSASIILSEPWYNPFIEKQAEDRVHRLGQNNQVNVYRLTIDNSVEKWIQGIKLKKLNIVSDINVFSDMSNIKIGGMNSSTFKMEDLQNLFSKHVTFTSSLSEDHSQQDSLSPNTSQASFSQIRSCGEAASNKRIII